MKTKYHVEITQSALQDYFSERALETIIQANIKQDQLAFQFGHDHIHFDSSAFDDGFNYIADQEQHILQHLDHSQFDQARCAFGRLLHSWQDFFSHSNYVRIWRCNHPDDPPEAIQIDERSIFHHPDLKSGKNYGVIEFIVMLPILSTLMSPLMPPDSHARMNLDSPSQNKDFAYAYWAAYKATRNAYQNLIQDLNTALLSEDIINRFKEK